MKQAVMVFETESERSSVLANYLSKGLTVYVKSIDQLQTFNGSSWEAAQAYSDIPAAVADVDVRVTLDMETPDTTITALNQEPLFYQIFNNYVDSSWAHTVWIDR